MMGVISSQVFFKLIYQSGMQAKKVLLQTILKDQFLSYMTLDVKVVIVCKELYRYVILISVVTASHIVWYSVHICFEMVIWLQRCCGVCFVSSHCDRKRCMHESFFAGKLSSAVCTAYFLTLCLFLCTESKLEMDVPLTVSLEFVEPASSRKCKKQNAVQMRSEILLRYVVTFCLQIDFYVIALCTLELNCLGTQGVFHDQLSL